MIKYGLISLTDANTIEMTLRLIFAHFPNDVIAITEVGVYGGDTANGMCEFVLTNERDCIITGVDSGRDGEQIRFDYDQLYLGDADEVAYKILDNSQHLVLIDACHCFAHVISNFFSYAPKVKNGGYFAFHDTGKHIQLFKDFQHGDKENPNAYISVRKALETIHLLGDNYIAHDSDKTYIDDWSLIFDEADINNPAGGFCIFKKM